MLGTCSRWGVLALWALGLGTGCLVGGINHSPVVTVGPTVSASIVMPGTQVALRLEVTDEDGDELTYRWAQLPTEPLGTFSDERAREPTWTAPEVAQATSFLLRVNILDGNGGALLSSVTVQVLPRR